MVMTAAEAEALIATRDRTGRLLVVGVPGQPLAAGPRRGADDRERRGRGAPQRRCRRLAGLGRPVAPGTWRQVPALSGGGFLFDTGAHMLNTVARPGRRGRAGGRRLARGRRRPGRRPGRGHGAADVRRARDDERLRSGDPVARLGHPASSASGRRSGPGSGASTWRSSATARPAAPASRRSAPRIRLGPVPRRAGRPRAEPEPARGRAAHGPAVGRDPGVVGAGWCGRPADPTMEAVRMTTRVTVWNEYRQEHTDPPVAAIYPDGIHGGDRRRPARGRRASRCGPRPSTSRSTACPTEVLAATDVLTWWGHVAHDEVTDAIVDRVHERVLDGMGLVVLHSGPLLADLPAADGHDLRPEVARGRPPRAALGRGPVASDRRGSGRVVRPPRGGDVRRALRHPGAGRARARAAGSRAARSSAAAAPGGAAGARSSTCARATRPTRRTSTRTSGG